MYIDYNRHKSDKNKKILELCILTVLTVLNLKIYNKIIYINCNFIFLLYIY